MFQNSSRCANPSHSHRQHSAAVWDVHRHLWVWTLKATKRHRSEHVKNSTPPGDRSRTGPFRENGRRMRRHLSISGLWDRSVGRPRARSSRCWRELISEAGCHTRLGCRNTGLVTVLCVSPTKYENRKNDPRAGPLLYQPNLKKRLCRHSD